MVLFGKSAWDLEPIDLLGLVSCNIDLVIVWDIIALGTSNFRFGSVWSTRKFGKLVESEVLNLMVFPHLL